MLFPKTVNVLLTVSASSVIRLNHCTKESSLHEKLVPDA